MTATLMPGGSLRRVAEIVRNAILFGPEAWEGTTNHKKPAHLLPSDADVVELFTLLNSRSVAYLLVGGIAMLRYVQGRNTEDIDLLMSLTSLRQMPEIVLEEKNEYFARGRFRSVRVDVLLTANALFSEVQQAFGTTHRFEEIEVPTATAEGLVLLKLYALPSLYRQGRLERVAVYESDITTLVGMRRVAFEPLFGRLELHVSESDLRELRRIAAEIEQRIARFNELKRT